ncbi:MAG: ATP-dependent sacrificial sulfur transferase LarE [Spirochaetales bacterium]|jgi:uncharacterized protein|nr:ATP-dependent sacrificial sulfur transferase LarE [Spirochaetales bacterium]
MNTIFDGGAFCGLDEKRRKLREFLASRGAAAVAFSGGVDSSFLCAAAFDVLGDRAVAITVVSPMLPAREIACARDVASRIGIEHILLPSPDIEADVAPNPANRCYLCKKHEFGAILARAKMRNIDCVLDGTNADDEGDYRPGLKAIAELGVFSPLREAGLTKSEIRFLSQERGLPTWDKPAFACLASRIPYGSSIDAAKLQAVERAENTLMDAGFRQVRVRWHGIAGGALARIEVAPDEREKFFDTDLLDSLSEKIKEAGFVYVSFELAGYRMGSMNSVLKEA